LAAFGTCILLGFEQQETLTAISRQQPVKGRFDRYRSKSGVFVIVDYAHTPDAVTNVLQTIHDIRTGDEKVITVIGAGGDRDKTKRPLMAQEAAKQSDMVILTSDNPRSEEPLAIIADMEAGLKEMRKSVYIKNPDRREAIKTACTMAQQGDIILIAGKGHENYQEIKGVRYPFDDMIEAIAILKNIDK
ncbi:MAG TPA: cyanophycin synthetase, partial [Salinivirgaceae bacterium]|nr:cyanophycin synthetase [Salinivirgaceae bacterium]